MIAMTLAQVADAVGGRLVGSGLVGGGAPGTGPADRLVDGPVVTDSRECGPGSLYVARRGASADGHDYVAAAVAAGAVAALVEREVHADVPQVLVDDSQVAFGRLARRVVDLGRAGGLVVVAVTGSSGKTGTKDLLAAVLAPLGEVVAAPESYNSEIGVPLTVCRATPGTRYLVVEMGARGAGHLTYLTGIAPPDVSVVLNVGLAHAGEFGSLEAVQAAKGELVEALRPDGVAVLNRDDPRVAAMAARTRAEVVLVSAGGDPQADVAAERVEVDDLGRASFDLVSRLAAPDGAAGTARVALRLHGEHHVGNALSAAAVALRLGLGTVDVATALSAAVPASGGRMELVQRPDGVVVVNDAYNANPDSVRAALKALASMGRAADGSRRRTWAVLGEMLELGEDAVRLHDEVGRLAVRLDVSRVVAVGAGARAVHTGAVMEGSWGAESVWVPDADAARQLLREELEPGDVVLLKSSRDSGLRRLGEQVVADGDSAAPTGGGRS